jgi:transcriptional regulator with GAF, ATPase, and Fis domain
VTSAAADERLHFETLLADLSVGFGSLAGGQLDGAIEAALAGICACLGLDRSGLWLADPDSPAEIRLAHAYQPPRTRPAGSRAPAGAGPQPPVGANGRRYFPWILARLARGETVVVARPEALPAEAAVDRASFRAFGFRTAVVLPLAHQDSLLGALCLEKTAGGGAVRLFGVIRDITELKRSEDALRRSLAEVTELKSRLEAENLYLASEHRSRFGQGQITGESRAIGDVLAAVEQVAPQRTTVLVTGETGVGKELVARRIHELSPRARRPMVKVNCSALPSTLVESELFGREKGAYTGSVSRALGRFEVADGSTIFLDEVAELPIELQAKLLRVLEEGEFERVGSSHTLRTDARVIAATNRDLEAEVAAGRFRRDLYYRLSAFPIRVPPLRERREDIPLLIWAIIEAFSASMHREVTSIPRRTVEMLKMHDWPGNVRELRNVIERAMIRSAGPTLEVEVPGSPQPREEPATSLDEAQRRHIAAVLEAARGRVSGPASDRIAMWSRL